MALLYPWATKEYLLWDMSLPQIILYHNIGVEIKYPKPDDGKNSVSLKDKSLEEILKKREELRKQYGAV
jgi:hypothetical protein